MKVIHFISGLPRSGSTLLANLLNQNPRFEATATSGILEILFLVRNRWDKIIEFQSNLDRGSDEAAKIRVLAGILDSYHAASDRPIIFDKSRSWLAHIELAEHILQRNVKILVPVRDVRDVLASFERLWRENASHRQTPQEADNYATFQSVEGRCAVWLKPEQPVGLAYNRIRDALHRGFEDRLHLVRFEDLTSAPGETLNSIYKFLGENLFEHDFDHVDQVTNEDDRVYGFADLHTIRNKIAPTPARWPAYLGANASHFGALNFWEH